MDENWGYLHFREPPNGTLPGTMDEGGDFLEPPLMWGIPLGHWFPHFSDSLNVECFSALPFEPWVKLQEMAVE